MEFSTNYVRDICAKLNLLTFNHKPNDVKALVPYLIGGSFHFYGENALPGLCSRCTSLSRLYANIRHILKSLPVAALTASISRRRLLGV